MKKWATLIGAAVLAASGCAGARAADQSFESTEDLAKALGWKCSGSDAAKTKRSLQEFGWAQAACDSSHLTIFESDAKRNEIQGLSWNALKPGWCRIEGRNWSAGGTQYIVEDAHKRVGGRLTCV